MENKINIAKILEGCPKGTKLYSPVCGDCTLCLVGDYIIEVIDTNVNHYHFYYDGTYVKSGECLLFPSKENRDWSKFQRPFKDGDIVAFDTEKGAQLFIFKEYIQDHWYIKSAKCYMMLDCGGEIDFESGGYYVERLATEEEKEKLFDAIKANGYKWNAETKTLEKLVESRFHEGDWITDGVSKCQILLIDDIQYWYSENCILGSIESVDKRYHLWTINDAKDGDVLAINWHEGDDYWEKIVIFKKYHNEDKWVEGYGNTFKNRKLDWNEEVPYFSKTWTGTLQPATKEQRDFLFQKIKEAGYKWNEETKTLDKLVESHTPKKFYIRIGDIPSEEKSAVYKGDVVIGYEDGVSVYDCVETDGLYRIVMPFPLKEGQGMTYECLIQEITQCRYKIENPRNVYLVSGMEVGKGNDNETLIKEVKILKDLTGQFNTKTDNTEETKTLDKLMKFKDGDIVFYNDTIAIFKEWGDETLFRAYVIKYLYNNHAIVRDVPLFGKSIRKEVRLATEEEKAKLFQAIKDNGYKWNPKTKTLNKLPKFKVGDRIKYRSGEIVYRIVQITEDSYVLDNLCSIPISIEHMYNLVPNKFDITTLKPFESKVLMRSSNAREWVGTIYSHYNNNKFYGCGMCCDQCIPYEGNEHLIGKIDDCNDFYKNW